MNQELNHRALVADIREISSQIKLIKNLLRACWARSMASEQRLLHREKQRATELCALRAFARGKLHLRKAPRGAAPDWDAVQYHRRVAERLGPSYALVLEQSA